MNKAKIHFLGAAGTVTGSKYLIETPEATIMVDCGVFQGLKELRLQNWEPFPFEASSIDYVLLTHGHLDHVGYLPRLVSQGFHGKILATAPTLEVAETILRDSAKIHEEEAEKANTEGYSKHHPALPFFDTDQVLKTLDYFQSVAREMEIPLSKNNSCTFRYNGHIIGSTFLELQLFNKLFVFSGDVGRQDDVLLFPPERPQWADYLFLESTYGNKNHPVESVEDTLSSLIKETIQQRGVLIIPSFAVERLQVLMYVLWKLYQKNRIPNIPIFVDSPMGQNVTQIFERYPDWHKLNLSEIKAIQNRMEIIQSYRETWETIDDPRPKVVIAGSGMITGGRVLTYVKQLAKLPSTTILLVGFQSEGTRGRKLLEGASTLKMFGKSVPVKAKVHHLDSLSAHADQEDLMHWISDIKNIPETVFLIHGEEEARKALRQKIQEKNGWNVQLPILFQTNEILV